MVAKSQAADPWPGNPPPRVHETTGGMLNSVGLQGRGRRAWLAHDLPDLVAAGARVVASIWGRSVEDYRRAADLLADAPPSVVAVEVNLSCPNVEHRSAMFAHSAVDAAAAMLGHARDAADPAGPSSAPTSPTWYPSPQAVAGAGAEAVTLVNTVMGMAIDPDTRTYRLGSGDRGGGLSGPAIHPIAVRAVHDVHRALPDLPIVGVGGVSTGVDAAELLLAGASAVQVGTATFADPRAPRRVLDELQAWCADHGVTHLDDLIGSAHG